MVGGGVWEPGQWTDDTSMAIAEGAAGRADLREETVLDRIVERWQEWMQAAKGVGIQTSQVLRTAGSLGLSARTAREAAAALHNRTGRTAGNGSDKPIFRRALARPHHDRHRRVLDAGAGPSAVRCQACAPPPSLAVTRPVA